MTYQQYTVKDFVLDERFNRWVKTNDPAEAGFWEKWQAQHPEKSALLLEARAIVLALSEDKDDLAPQEMAEMWEVIQQRRHLTPRVSPVITHPIARVQTWPRWASLAAAVTGMVLLAGALLYLLPLNKIQVRTTSEETKTIRLPDGSTVILNANSTLSYARDWNKETPREIWLDGGAYFQVTHQQGGKRARFLVHTSEVEVEVLGTTFNVLEKGHTTKVVLSTGQVSFRVNDQPQTLLMKPGEVIEYSDKDKKIEQRKVRSEVYKAWRANKWVLKDATLNEVTQMIEETFGTTVVLEEESIGFEKMTGVVPIDDMDKLLKGLTGIYELQVTRQEGKIILSRNKE